MECGWPPVAGKANRFILRASRKESSPTDTYCHEGYKEFKIDNCEVFILHTLVV